MTCDRDLLARAQRLDTGALGEIYDVYSPGLYRYAFRLLGCADLAEDCVADVFSRFLHSLHAGNGPRDHMQAYLYRIAHNWIADHWRREPPPPLTIDQNLYTDGKGDPCRTLEEQTEQAQVRAALADLTPDQRQVVTLKYLEGLGNEEIAMALGKPVGAVKSLQHRALAALRRALRRAEELHELYS